MRKALSSMALLATLALGASAAHADSCCPGGKCGSCCVNCTKCTSHCSPAKCCKK